MKFKVKSGVHADENGIVYQKGEMVKSNHDLASMFPNKFVLAEVEKVKSTKPQRQVEIPPVLPPQVEGTEDEEEVDDEVNFLGTDVTSDFKLAQELGFKVFKNENGFNVVSEDDTEVVLNHAILRTKQTVNKFIQKSSEAV